MLTVSFHSEMDILRLNSESAVLCIHMSLDPKLTFTLAFACLSDYGRLAPGSMALNL